MQYLKSNRRRVLIIPAPLPAPSSALIPEKMRLCPGGRHRQAGQYGKRDLPNIDTYTFASYNGDVLFVFLSDISPNVVGWIQAGVNPALRIPSSILPLAPGKAGMILPFPHISSHFL